MAAPSRRAGSDRASFTAANQRAKAKASAAAAAASFNQDQYSNVGHSFNDNASLMRETPETTSIIAEEEADQLSPPSAQSRKRKRGGAPPLPPPPPGAAANDSSLSVIEQNHIIYGDQLLDYFMTVGDVPSASRVLPPVPPPHFQVDRPIDDQGNTALHWACAMGDIDIIKDLINRGANIGARSNHDETPLVRAVLFTNNYEKRTMEELADLLQNSIACRDWFGATVFNHIAQAARSKGKWKSSRYYCQVLIDKLSQIFPSEDISLLLASQDSNGDTAALTAAANGCYRLATRLLAHCPEAGELQNKHGESANELLMKLSRRSKENPPAPSSATHHDFPGDGDYPPLPNASPHQSTEVVETTSALLSRVSSIMEEANRRLARAYGEVKPPVQGAESSTNPKGLYEQLEADREAIRAQNELLVEKDGGFEPFEEQRARYGSIKSEYEAALRQRQREELLQRFQAVGCLDIKPLSSSADKTADENGNGNGDGDGDDDDDALPSSMSSESEIELWEKYDVVRELLEAEAKHQTLLQELVQQQADAGVSARLDVHRKLVSLATGLGEDELDPMASELADMLEFDRANERRPSRPAPDPRLFRDMMRRASQSQGNQGQGQGLETGA